MCLQFIRFLTCLSLLNLAFAAPITASLDRNNISQAETFTLSIRTDGNSNDSPNPEPLEKDFKILSTSQQTQLSFVNGKSESFTLWQFRLLAKHTGKLIIPALTVGQDQSATLTITVSATPDKDSAQDKDVFMLVSATPASAYPDTQIHYQAKLFYRVQLLQAQLEPPQADNADIIPIDKDSLYQTLRNNKTYEVLERNYIIIPRQAGSLSIKPPLLSAQVPIRTSPLDPWQPFVVQNTRAVQAPAPTIKINVKPTPATSDGMWLPAYTMTLSEKWSQTDATLHVGEPITRTITLHGNGITAEQLPNVELATVAGLKYYPDKPIVATTFNNPWLDGTRSQSIAIIPTQAGNVTIPGVTIQWWDLHTQQPATVTLPAKTLQVQAATTTATPVTAVTAAVKVAPQPTPTNSARPIPWFWLGAVLLLVLGWLGTILWFWHKQGPAKVAKINTNHTRNNKINPATLQRAVENACRTNDAKAAEKALLAWATYHWQHKPVTNLPSLQKLYDNTAWHSALSELQTACYQPNHGAWQGSALLVAFAELSKQPTKDIKKTDTLPPLYP